MRRARPPLAGRAAFPYVFAGLTALLLWGFASVADEVIEGDTTTFDDAVTAFFRDRADPADPWGPPWFEEAVRDVTGLGSFTVLGFVLLATVVYFAWTAAAAPPSSSASRWWAAPSCRPP